MQLLQSTWATRRCKPAEGWMEGYYYYSYYYYLAVGLCQKAGIGSRRLKHCTPKGFEQNNQHAGLIVS